MDHRPVTSSNRSQDGSAWSFMNSATNSPVQATQPRSQHSSYLRSERYGLQHSQRTHDGTGSSRSLSRNLPSTSTGARSTTSLPSQPVLSRIHSEYAYGHNNHNVIRSRRPIEKTMTGLPAVKEFSMAGILAAVEEDIEGHVNIIAEILGRNRFVLADEYGAQLPPQGEIMGEETIIEEIEEAEIGDNVIILNEDSSLVDGSAPGSDAYGFLERLQANRPARMTSDSIISRPIRNAPLVIRTTSSPATVQPVSRAFRGPRRRPPSLLMAGRGLSRPVVSGTWLSAEADGMSSGRIPPVSEAGRHNVLNVYAGDDAEMNELLPSPDQTQLVEAARPGRSMFGGVFARFSTHPQRRLDQSDSDAQARLRNLLNH